MSAKIKYPNEPIEAKVIRKFPPSTRYELIICWSDTDQAFVAEVPELPGCMADGATYVEAVTNAQQVIDEWIATA